MPNYLANNCPHDRKYLMTGIREDGSSYTECLECETVIEHTPRPKTQTEKILHFMRSTPEKTWWSATDFQKAPYFIGYEASARISDLMRQYPNKIQTKRAGRFRVIRLRENRNVNQESII